MADRLPVTLSIEEVDFVLGVLDAIDGMENMPTVGERENFAASLKLQSFPE